VAHSAPGELRCTASGGGLTASILISARGRPTRNTLRVIGEGGTAHLDLFHGFAVLERGSASRSYKIGRPLALAARTFAAAARNLAGRALRGETAYPGLRGLVAAFHRAVRHDWPSPIAPFEALEVARARDELLAATGLR
jgi:hypothetical protein